MLQDLRQRSPEAHREIVEQQLQCLQAAKDSLAAKPTVVQNTQMQLSQDTTLEGEAPLLPQQEARDASVENEKASVEQCQKDEGGAPSSGENAVVASAEAATQDDAGAREQKGEQSHALSLGEEEEKAAPAPQPSWQEALQQKYLPQQSAATAGGTEQEKGAQRPQKPTKKVGSPRTAAKQEEEPEYMQEYLQWKLQKMQRDRAQQAAQAEPEVAVLRDLSANEIIYPDAFGAQGETQVQMEREERAPEDECHEQKDQVSWKERIWAKLMSLDAAGQGEEQCDAD